MHPLHALLIEDLMLVRLQAGEPRALKDMLKICGPILDEYTGTKLHDFKRGKELNDQLLSKWLREGFADATSPITEWMTDEIDSACRELLIGMAVKFVHGLQNFYYSLRGQMLTLPAGISKPS